MEGKNRAKIVARRDVIPFSSRFDIYENLTPAKIYQS